MTTYPFLRKGRWLCLFLICLSFSIPHVSAQDLTQTPVTKDVNYAIGGYYECLPLNYNKSGSKKYPLLIFIHGIGELGDGSEGQLKRILKNGVTKLIEKKKFPNSFTVNGQTSSFIIISPQFRKNYRDADAVTSLIDYCIANYQVDESRIYLTGLSMGGGISWVYARKSAANAGRLAAMLTVCGNTNASSSGIANIAAASLPVWATHNSDDPIVTSTNSVNWITGLNAYRPVINPKALLNIFNSTSHDAWSKTYDPDFKPNGLNVYEWLLSHKRGESVAPANKPPVANAGSDKTITLPESSVSVTGLATDTDGSIANYKWTKLTGPDGSSIKSPDKATTKISALEEGTYTFRLTATDDDGATATDDVKVTVKPAPNEAPTADAGKDLSIRLPVDSVFLKGKGSDEDGTIASYEWTKISGPASGAVTEKNAPQVWLTDLAEGTYVFRLHVADNQGATATDDVRITVKPEKPLIAKAGQDTLIYKNQTRSDTVVLNGAASVGGIHYKWRKMTGPGATSIKDSSALTTYATGLKEGTHVFQLTIDGKAYDTVQVVVRDWQKKNAGPCRPGGGKSFVVPESRSGYYYHPYLNRDNTLGEPVMGGDTLYFEGGMKKGFEIGDFGGSVGCPVYIMPKDEALVITGGYFRIGTRDSNVVQHAILDGTVLRGKGIPYGFFIDNRNVTNDENTYPGLAATWVSHFTVKGYRAANTGIMQIKLDAKEAPYGRYDKFIQKRIHIQDNFIDGSTAEGLYIGHTASNGGQLNNPYGPPPRMDSIEILDNIIMNCGWDGIQLANARTAAVIKHNFVYKTGLLNKSSQRSGILMGANTTGTIDSNIVINSKGIGIQVMGFGAVKVRSNIIDSIYCGSGNQDGIYQSHISVLPETENRPLSVTNVGNLISRVERMHIKVANNNGDMIPGRTYNNTFIDSAERSAADLVNAGAGDAVDNNEVVEQFPFHVNKISTKKENAFISMTQGDATKNFTTVKAAVDWLFERLKSVSAANEAPVANAGSNHTITLPQDSVSVDGSGIDTDGSVVSYQWRQLSGAADAIIHTPTEAGTRITTLSEGVYTFELKVTDNGKATGRDTVTITVKPVIEKENKAPKVHAGNNARIILPVNTITLKGTATDDDGTITATAWTKISGPDSYSVANDTALQTRVDSLTEGVYRFQLSATDNKGATAQDTVKITVVAEEMIPANEVPLAVAGPDQSIQLPSDSIQLKGTGTDNDGAVESYRWEQLSGPAMAIVKNKNAAATLVTKLTKGVYQFAFTVTDNQGAANTDTLQVTVLAKPNARPAADAGMDQTIRLPVDSITLYGEGHDEDGFIKTYRWTQISGPSLQSITGANTALVQGLKEGIYLFELNVTDNEGATTADTVKVTVNAAPLPNKPPVAQAGTDVVVQLPQDDVVLSGSGSDEDGSIKTYQWKQLSGPAVATFSQPQNAQTSVNGLIEGIYQVKLVVTDNDGATGADTVLITVKAAPQPVSNSAPVVTAGTNITLTLPVNATTLSGAATDGDGTIVNYQWTKVSGPAQCILAKPQAAQTDISNLVEGVYRFELKATDNKGATGSDTLVITVVAPAMRPEFVMGAGADNVITLPTDSIRLEAVTNDPHRIVKSYNWRKISGPKQYRFDNAKAARTNVTALVEGIYLFACTATDTNGNTRSDTVQITVKALAKSMATVFPNPSNGVATILINANTRATTTRITLYNISGRVVYQETFMRNKGTMSKELNLSHLPTGIYTVEIVADINTKISTILVKR